VGICGCAATERTKRSTGSFFMRESVLQLVSRVRGNVATADGACEARSRSDEEGDAHSSPTSRDDEIARNLHRR
jgi:hypothetical protein